MKRVPEIFVNKINKNISNNKEVYYSYNDKNVYEEDITVLKEKKELYNTIIKKYKKEVEKWNFKDKKIKIVNEILSMLMEDGELDKNKAFIVESVDDDDWAHDLHASNLVDLMNKLAEF